jgi:hypothetical protein
LRGEAFAALDGSDDRRPHSGQASQQHASGGITDTNPNNGGAGRVERVQQDKVLVLGHDTRIHISGPLPDSAVGHALDPEITDVLRFMPLGNQPSAQGRRQIGVDEKPHGRSAAAKTG